jgi:GntR family transcriptional repressor for pyruvate dehydrogenase complex
MKSDRLTNVRLYEQLAERIRTQIVDGDLSAGDKLPNERDLAEQFGVSRTVVREALKTLKQEGLIEVRPGAGTFVVNATGEVLTQTFGLMMSIGKEKSLAEIIEIREILEPEIAALAAHRATPEDVKAMEHAVALMNENLEDIHKYVHEDHSFHLTLAEATKNIIIPRLIASIVDLLHELREKIALTDGARERGQEHHYDIINAIKAKDPEAARAAMRRHLKQVRQDSGTENISYEEDANG